MIIDDDLVIHDHVEAPAPTLAALVEDRDADLPGDRVSSRNQFLFHGRDVKVLQEAESKRVVYLKKSTDDGSRERLLEQSGHAGGSLVATENHQQFISHPRKSARSA